nr:hypothetical protein [Tanacetum cinerariifolium]
MRQQSEKGKGGRKHHQELIPKSMGRLKMKRALVASRNATWPVDEEKQKNNLLGEKFTELVNNYVSLEKSNKNVNGLHPTSQ